MDKQKKSRAESIVNYMLDHDSFSQWLGITINEVDEGYCKISCIVNKKMLNGFGVTHGGILFSLADSALAFSASSYGRVSLAIDNSISFLKKSYQGTTLTATSSCIHLSHKTGVFDIKIFNEEDEMLAMMKGTVYRTDKEFSL